MADSSSDQWMCSVCLERLKEPVTIPCGHSYCMSCITDYWSQKQTGPYSCPQCRESFSQRPLLKKNTLIAEMMETLQKSDTHMQTLDCDVCSAEKKPALKSCLQCLASFCQTHLQPHYQSPAFMKHKLVDASINIQENICVSHGKQLDIYCQDDQQCICYLCMIDNHKGHSVVSVDSKWTNRKKKLRKIKKKCVKLIEERETAQQELNKAIDYFQSSAAEAEENVDQVFTEFICSLEDKRSEIKEQIRNQEKTESRRAEQIHQHLDQELTELRQRQAEIQKLLTANDQIHGLKSCESVCVLPSFKDLPSFTQHTYLPFSISAFKEALEDVFQQKTKRMSREVSNIHIVECPEPKTPNDFSQYFYEIHLDPNTVQENLILSEENTKVSHSNEAQTYPDHLERFDGFPYVLCREELYGRCYWEVEGRGKDWSVAVSYKEINRKGKSTDSRLGFNNKSWRLTCFNQHFYIRHDKTQVSVAALLSCGVGVYVDHRAGTLSFYSVSDKMTLIYRFQTTFTEPLYPAFGVGENSYVRIIKQNKM